MTFDEMVTFVRNHVDADSADAPDSNLTVYARMAYNDILSRAPSWPHLEVTYTLTTVGGTNTYPLSGLSGGANMDVVYAVLDTAGVGTRLVQITRADGDLFFTTASASVNSSNAVAFSIFNDNIMLYPTPTSVKTYVVRGFRSAAGWPTDAASIPDLPRVFDEAICWYMLSGYYMAQEDPQLAGVYLNEYMGLLDKHIKDQTGKNSRARPTIMGGQVSRINGTFLDRVRGVLE